MGLVLLTDPVPFRDRVWPLLEARRDANVIATVLLAVIAADQPLGARFGYWQQDDGAIVAAALRTPPRPMLVTGSLAALAEPFLAGWLAADPELPGIYGMPEVTHPLLDAWRSTTGARTELARSMAMHVADRPVDPPRPPSGRLRRCRSEERALVVDWWTAFSDEALGGEDREHAQAMADTRLATDGVWFWDDDGPVALVAISPPVAGVPRIGPVYTPPAHRRRGYAGMAVAEVTRRALARGAGAVMLFTDLANPTSNKIYAEVGYRRVGDWEEHLLR